jgi:hypothetical protein
MTNKRHTRDYWRERAIEIRQMAESFDNKDTKRVLLGIADDFDELAQLAIKDIGKAISQWDNNRRADAVGILLNAPFSHAKEKK